MKGDQQTAAVLSARVQTVLIIANPHFTKKVINTIQQQISKTRDREEQEVLEANLLENLGQPTIEVDHVSSKLY